MRIYRRGETWYVDYYFAGRRTRKKVGGRRDAENALAAVKADILRGEYRFKAERKIRFEKFAEEYLKYAKANKRSWAREEIALGHFNPFFAGKLLTRITPKDIEDYKQKRLEKVKPSTINRELAQLKFMFNLAKKWKYANENPVKEVRFFQERQLAMRTINKEEARKLIDAAGDRLKSIIIVALNTGMRRGEILNLRWKDIDFDMHYIYIKESKTGMTRKIPMNPLVEKTLRNIDRKSELVFCSSISKGILNYMEREWRKACGKAKIKDFRFHDCRHTFATWMIIAGVDLVTVKEILGHANIQTTMRYAHPTPENKRRAVNIISSILGEKPDTIQAQKEKSQVETSLLSNN